MTFACMSIFLPSSIEPLISPYFDNNTNIDLLRDDLIHPIVSGNKWRKLKYIIEDFKASNAEVLVTFGGAYSNHLVATAFAGNAMGIRTFGFVRGDENRPLNHYETLCVENGMTLKHVSREAYRNKAQLFAEYFNQSNAYFVDEGGDHPKAYIGCMEILNELNKQYDYIVLSVGTGTTMQGLVMGLAEQKSTTKVVGISSLKNNLYLNERLSDLDTINWEVMHDFHRGKYAKMDSELWHFIHSFYKETGIKTDPVYTAKMLMAVKTLYQTNYFKPNDKLLLIHTGGLLAFKDR